MWVIYMIIAIIILAIFAVVMSLVKSIQYSKVAKNLINYNDLENEKGNEIEKNKSIK